MNKLAAWVSLVVLLGVATVSRAEEWPKWMGPNGDGISTEKGLLTKWPEGGPAKLWTVDVGLGFATPVALDGTLYMFAMQGDKDVLIALNADDGKTLWSQSYPVSHKPKGPQATNEANGLPVPCATPTIDGDRIYTYGGGGELVCRQLKDGAEVWKLNVLDATSSTVLMWDEASAPLVTDKLVYVQNGTGSCVAVAVDKATGKLAWKSEATGPGGYAAIIQVTVAGKPELIVFGGATLYGMDPETGKTLWSAPWKTMYDVNATTPVYRDGHLFITSSYGHGCGMFTLDASGAKEEWKSKDVQSKYQPVILNGDHLYANSAGRLKCLQWPEKTTLWSEDLQLADGGSLVLVGNQMIAMSENGKLMLLNLKPGGIDVAGEVQLFNYNHVWSSPLIYHGKLYCKGKDQLVALKVK